jgi:hypothetical protein
MNDNDKQQTAAADGWPHLDTSGVDEYLAARYMALMKATVWRKHEAEHLETVEVLERVKALLEHMAIIVKPWDTAGRMLYDALDEIEAWERRRGND